MLQLKQQMKGLGNISQPSDAKVATFQDFIPKVPSKTPVTKVTSLTPDEVNQG